MVLGKPLFRQAIAPGGTVSSVKMGHGRDIAVFEGLLG